MYYHAYGYSTESVENLAINFLTTLFHTSEISRYRKTGFNPCKTLTEIFTNKYTSTYASDTTTTCGALATMAAWTETATTSMGCVR